MRPSRKLDHVKYGPFRILEKLGPVTYRLNLPKGTRAHPVFHVALLTKAPDGMPEATEQELQEQEGFYEVEKILDYKK